MAISEVKLIMKNGKQIHPELPDGCVGYWDFTLQKNTDINRAMTPDLSGNGNHAIHYNFAYAEKDYSQETTAYSAEKIGKTKQSFNLYKYRVKDWNVLEGGKYIRLSASTTIKPNQTISGTVYVKYEGVADFESSKIIVYKFASTDGGNKHLASTIYSEAGEKDSDGFTKLSVSFTNTTTEDILNTCILFYGARNRTDYLSDGTKLDTYFYIESVNDGVTALRSGYFGTSESIDFSGGGIT